MSAELTEQKIPYEIGRAYFKDTARAHISGEEVGMLKYSSTRIH